MAIRRPMILGVIAVAALLSASPAAASNPCFGSAVTIPGTAVGETLNGTSGNDVIDGAGGNDVINGMGGNDKICGDAGDDTIDGGPGNDQMDGEGHVNGDTVVFTSVTSQLTANLATGVATATNGDTDSLSNFENLTGTNTFDLLTGDAGPNVLRGLDAADGFRGGGGDDTLVDQSFPVDFGAAIYDDATGPVIGTVGAGTHTVTGQGVGTDTLTDVRGIQGSNFDDQLSGDGIANAIDGMGGNDLLEPLGGADFVGGEGGTDTITYANETGPVVTTDLSSGATGNVTAPGGNDSVFDVENLIGSAQNDDITGGSENNVFDGRGGDDTLNGAGGNDTASFSGLSQVVDANLATGAATGQGSDTLTAIENLTGSDQNDFLTGDGGDNIFNGGPGGTDTVRFSGVTGGVTASLATGAGTGQGSDTLANIANLTGSLENDTLVGNGSANVLSGLDGTDNLTGGLGPDTLLLGAGLDTITANDGVVDVIDCEGGGPDSGSVDGPAPAETYTLCDTDGDSVVDFLDACPAASGSGTDGCVPPVITPPVLTPPPAQAQAPPTTKKKCKKKKKHAASAAKKKKCKKKKR